MQWTPDWYGKTLLVLGCGNLLLGDDGFGPAVVRYCEEHLDLPDTACVLDVGTAVREVLFDVLLAEDRPARIVIVDAVDRGLEPGELTSFDVDALPPAKVDDFSLHLVPASNLLRELRDLAGVEVEVLACQVGHIPALVEVGLSEPVTRAVGVAARRVLALAQGP